VIPDGVLMLTPESLARRDRLLARADASGSRCALLKTAAH
jgi:hypothetical protein